MGGLFSKLTLHTRSSTGNMYKASIILIILYLLIYLVPLGFQPLIIPDETRYAEIPREMIATGDWIVPHLNGVRYFEKPILGYWIDAAAQLVFGENNFSVRFPSALSMGICALMIFGLVRRYNKSGLKALFACCIFLTFVEVFAIGMISVLDGLFSMWVTLSLGTFFIADKSGKTYLKSIYYAVFGMLCGLSFLTKGFLGFAIPGIVIIPFVVWEKKVNELLKYAWISIVAASLTALPWSILIHLRANDFWHYFFWIEHIKRFASDNAQHAAPFWSYLPIIVVGALPWGVFSPSIVLNLKKIIKHENTLLKFVICWIIFPFLFFSIARGKLATYILPCFAPLSILFAIGLSDLSLMSKHRTIQIPMIILGLLTLGACMFLLINRLTDVIPFKLYSAKENFKWVLALNSMVIWTLFLGVAIHIKDYWQKWIWFTIAPLFFFISVHGLIPNPILERKAPCNLIRRYANTIPKDAIIVSEDDLVPAICWVLKRDDIYVHGWIGEFEYGLSYADSKQRRLNHQTLKQLIEKCRGRCQIFIISAKDKYTEYKSLIPHPVWESHAGGLVFLQF